MPAVAVKVTVPGEQIIPETGEAVTLTVGALFTETVIADEVAEQPDALFVIVTV